MPGPLSKPSNGKTKVNRLKDKRSKRELLGKGLHGRGSQNKNKSGYKKS